jgi:hypothetical protein
VADDVRGQDRCEPAFNTLVLHSMEVRPLTLQS